MEGRMLMVPLQRIIRPGVISGMRLLLIHHEQIGSFALQGVSKCILTECGVEDAVVLGEFLGVTGKRTIGMAKGLPDGRKIIAMVPRTLVIPLTRNDLHDEWHSRHGERP